MADVCCLRTQCNHSLWLPFAFPHGAGYLAPQQLSCRLNGEVGVSNAWLPVTHTANEGRGTHGLWFYYARGCSDLLWYVGRTLLARNRCAAALALERLARGGSDRDAAERLASSTAASTPTRLDGLLKQTRTRANRFLKPTNVSLPFLIAECARGVHGDCSGATFDAVGKLRPCKCSSNWWRPSGRRPWIMAWLASWELLMPRIEQLLRELSYDSLQLYQQPQGASWGTWTIELLDARSLDYAVNIRKALVQNRREFNKLGARLDQDQLHVYTASGGSVQAARRCIPSRNFTRCMACVGSLLEEACSA